MSYLGEPFPSELLDLIKEEYPPFGGLRMAHQQNLTLMLWQCASPARRHRSWPGASFSSQSQEALWGNRRTRNTYVGEYFSVIQGDNLSDKTNSYQPMDFMGRALMKFLRSPKPMDFRHADGRRMALPRSVILSRARSDDPNVRFPKHAAWSGVSPSPTVPINQDALSTFIENSGHSMHALHALRLLRLSRNTLCPGEIPVQYQQARTGRLTEKLFWLQSTPREVLSAALTGYWDYDLKNAHFGIFAQWAKKLGKRTPVTDEYMGNKAALRSELAEHCQVRIEVIKECLLALLYGATFHPDPKRAKIADALGEEAHALFSSHAFVRRLKREIARVGKHIVGDLPKHAGQYGNALGIYVPEPSRNGRASILCHALQGVEARILMTVIEKCGENIALPMHDGWVARRRLSHGELESIVHACSGFELGLEVAQLPKYPPKSDGDGPLTFADSSPLPEGGFWISAAPQWSERDGVVGRVTRTDLPMSQKKRGDH